MDIYTAIIADFRAWIGKYDQEALIQPDVIPTLDDCLDAGSDRTKLLELTARATKVLAYMNTQKARLEAFEDALEPRRDMLLSRAISDANDSGFTYHDLRLAQAKQDKNYQVANRDLIRTRASRRMVESIIRNMEQLLNQADRVLGNK